MKVRHGHVSNSSTSSFFGIGIMVGDIQIKEEFLPTKEDDKYNDFFEEDGSINFDSYEFWEWLTYYSTYREAGNSKASKILNDEGVECETPYEEGEYRTLVVSYTKMKLDETKQQFIDRVKKALNKVFDVDESKIGHVDDAWRND
jgi:hypothetical protein